MLKFAAMAFVSYYVGHGHHPGTGAMQNVYPTMKECQEAIEAEADKGHWFCSSCRLTAKSEREAAAITREWQAIARP
jgi:hypothetical protein